MIFLSAQFFVVSGVLELSHYVRVSTVLSLPRPSRCSSLSGQARCGWLDIRLHTDMQQSNPIRTEKKENLDYAYAMSTNISILINVGLGNVNKIAILFEFVKYNK